MIRRLSTTTEDDVYGIEKYVFEGELLDDKHNCKIAFTRFCINSNVELVENLYEADVNNNPGQLIWACPECLQELVDEI